MSEPQFTPWKTGTDLFGALHVYDAGGDRLSNDRMSHTDDWEAKAHLIAAAPDLYRELTIARGLVEKWCHTQGNAPEFFRHHLAPIDVALAKARGEGS